MTIKSDVKAGNAFPEATGAEVTHDGLDEKTTKRALSDEDVRALMARTIRGLGMPTEGEKTKKAPTRPNHGLSA